MSLSLEYCLSTPVAPLTTSLPFQRSGTRRTNCASWFQPWSVLIVEVSGKYPSTCRPGTPLGFCVPGALSAAQSPGSVLPGAVVPAGVRAARQAATCFSAPGSCTSGHAAAGGAPTASTTNARALLRTGEARLRDGAEQRAIAVEPGGELQPPATVAEGHARAERTVIRDARAARRHRPPRALSGLDLHGDDPAAAGLRRREAGGQHEASGRPEAAPAAPRHPHRERHV